jgi:branched-chain amino acid aminotransferase
LYGTSVFEGIRAYYNAEEDQLYAFRVREHFERMFQSAKILFMSPNHTIDEYCAIVKEVLKRSNYREDAYIRPTLYKSAVKVGPDLSNNPDGDFIFGTKMGNYVDTSRGLNICTSSWHRLDDNMIPPRAKISGAYANTALIVTEAHKAGFDDAIVLTRDGHVAEGSAMNVFFVEGNKLVTPPGTENILVGITRNTIMEIAREELGMETVQRQIDRTEIYLFDEAFYCGTGAQVAPIGRVDSRDIGSGKMGEKTAQIQKLYFDIVKGKVEKYKKWCMRIYD